MSPEAQAVLDSSRPMWVVLRRVPPANALEGLVEESFGMSWQPDRVNVWWSGTAYSVLGTHTLNGEREATREAERYRREHPNWNVRAYDAEDPELPIVLDLEFWATAMLAGASRKYDARNAKFEMKE